MFRAGYSLFAVIHLIVWLSCDAEDRGLGIASITKLSKGSSCTDKSGNVYNHQGTWSTRTGSCDRNDCYHDVLNSDKYIVEYRCRKLDTLENPDSLNCRMTPAGDSQVDVFPKCCPVLVCDSRPPEPTVILPACRDDGVTSACQIWKQIGGCDSSYTDLYQYTSVYCKKTCEFCTATSGLG